MTSLGLGVVGLGNGAEQRRRRRMINENLSINQLISGSGNDDILVYLWIVVT